MQRESQTDPQVSGLQGQQTSLSGTPRPFHGELPHRVIAECLLDDHNDPAATSLVGVDTLEALSVIEDVEVGRSGRYGVPRHGWDDGSFMPIERPSSVIPDEKWNEGLDNNDCLGLAGLSGNSRLELFFFVE